LYLPDLLVEYLSNVRFGEAVEFENLKMFNYSGSLEDNESKNPGYTPGFFIDRSISALLFSAN